MKRETFSNCCEAIVLDNGLCSDCKEHCIETISEIVSVWVLDLRNIKVNRLLIPIQYESDAGYEVESFLADYYNHSDIVWMMTNEEIDFEDLDLT